MFPCDTRLEAFPPYLGRVSSLTRLLFLKSLKSIGYGIDGGGCAESSSLSFFRLKVFQS